MRYAIILAGGSGTRLWPWSRTRKPKQLLPLVHGRSLLSIAHERLQTVVAPDHLLVCAGQSFRDEICRELNLRDDQFLGEPVGRDTAAALGYCAAVLHQRDPEAVMAICTADHLIEPVPLFRKKLEEAFAVAESRQHALITFGVTPDTPSTAYGYLELGKPDGNALSVERFCEKPNLEVAKTFFAAGPKRYLWNSGMFVWKASTLLACLERYEPEIYESVQAIAKAFDTSNRDQVLGEVYPQIKKISIDYAVMERASTDNRVKVLAIPLSLNWLDIGSWNAFAQTCEADSNGNRTSAEHCAFIDSHRVMVASNDPNHLIAAIGCDDLVIVHTADATLVCRADRTESVKELQGILRQRHADKL